MMISKYLAVTGALSGAGKDLRFELPEQRRTTHSARFGHHALEAGETMRILPLGSTMNDRVTPTAAPAVTVRRAGTWRFRNKLLSFLM